MGKLTRTIFSATEECHFDATFLRSGITLFQYFYPNKSSRVTLSPHTRTHQFAVTRYQSIVEGKRKAGRGARDTHALT